MSSATGTHTAEGNLQDTSVTPNVPLAGALVTFQYSTDGGVTVQTDPNGGSATTDANGNVSYTYSLPVGTYTEVAFAPAQTIGTQAYDQSNTATRSFQIQAPPRTTQLTLSA